MAGKSFLVPIFCCLLLLSGCEKNETKYIADDQTNGLAVFSNTGNNIMTCFINGSPWRTDNLIVGGWGPGTTDFSIFKQYDSSFHYSLVFAWPGNLVNDSADIYLIELHLFVPANFSRQVLIAFRESVSRLTAQPAFLVLPIIVSRATGLFILTGQVMIQQQVNPVMLENSLVCLKRIFPVTRSHKRGLMTTCRRALFNFELTFLFYPLRSFTSNLTTILLNEKRRRCVFVPRIL